MRALQRWIHLRKLPWLWLVRNLSLDRLLKVTSTYLASLYMIKLDILSYATSNSISSYLNRSSHVINWISAFKESIYYSLRINTVYMYATIADPLSTAKIFCFCIQLAADYNVSKLSLLHEFDIRYWILSFLTFI